VPHFVVVKTTASEKFYMKSHRKTSDAVSGIEVTLDADVKKALLFSRKKNAEDRARVLSSDVTTYTVEPVTVSATVGDMVDESSEEPVQSGPVALKKK
jgi:hypothetical protein